MELLKTDFGWSKGNFPEGRVLSSADNKKSEGGRQEGAQSELVGKEA